MHLAGHLDLGVIAFRGFSETSLRQKLEVLAVFPEEPQDRLGSHDWLLERGLQGAIGQEQLNQTVKVVGVEQIHVAVDRGVDHTLDEHLLAQTFGGRSDHGLLHPLPFPLGGVVAHVHHEVAQQGDLLALFHGLQGAQHRRRVGGELVALGDRGHQARCHPLAELIPETQLDVHRPAGIGPADLRVAAVGQLTHDVALLGKAHGLDLV